MGSDALKHDAGSDSAKDSGLNSDTVSNPASASADTNQWNQPTRGRATAVRVDTAQLIPASHLKSSTGSRNVTIGGYQIRGVLGMGGMGVVYRGLDAEKEQEVAIKVLPEQLVRNEIALKRFLQEAKAAQKVEHPNVASIFETGEDDGTFYLVMEHLPGGSVAKLLQRGRLPWRKATCLVREACEGLTAMHLEGLVHRDIKPGNLLLTASGHVKVSDFGLVKSETRLLNTTMTKDGEILGTPDYMSPEQCLGQDVDTRSDIYSLGATYFALLTGRPAFTGTGQDLLRAHCHDEAPDPCEFNPKVPEACTYIIQKAMAKDPRQRYDTVEELRGDLEILLTDPETAHTMISCAPSRRWSSSLLPAPNEPAKERIWPLWAAAIAGVSLVVLGFRFIVF